MIKVLVVEDSSFLAATFKRMLESDPEISVVGLADSAEDTLNKVELLEPDVILLDIEAPGGALDVLDQVMRKHPTPTFVVGTASELGKKEIMSAFSYGALDFLVRPKSFLETSSITDELLAMVKIASSVEVKKLILGKRSKKPVKAPKTSQKVVVIGASSGGVIAVEEVITKLPKRFPAAVLVVQHMPPGFTKSFAERLDSICDINVEEAADGSRLEKGKVLIAPGGYNLEVVQKQKHLFTSLNKKHTTIKPNVDMAFKSVAEACGKNTIAVILTGMGKDGSEGIKWVKKNGGKTIAQDKETSLIYGMPKVVIDNGDADYVVPLPEIADKIADIL